MVIVYTTELSSDSEISLLRAGSISLLYIVMYTNFSFQVFNFLPLPVPLIIYVPEKIATEKKMKKGRQSMYPGVDGALAALVKILSKYYGI